MGPAEVVLGDPEVLEDTEAGGEGEGIAEGGKISCYGMIKIILHYSSASGKLFVSVNYKRTIIRVPLSV